MIYKLFVLLLTVNLFSVMVKAEASEFVSYSPDSYRSYSYTRAAGDDEILIEKDVSKSKCILRVLSMLGSQWFNDTVELQRIGGVKNVSKTSRHFSGFQDSLLQAQYGVDIGDDEFSLSMGVKF